MSDMLRSVWRLKLLYIISCLMAAEANTGVIDGVRLDSTLKQSSLCPGDDYTTFTCTASGTELVWIVGGRTLSFNRNANVGASRMNLERDVTAILLRRDDAEGNGYAVRLSVLTVDARPQRTSDSRLSVKCHNGSAHLANGMQFLPFAADPPARPEMEATYTEYGVANISWTSSNSSDLSYYAISADDGLAMLTKNTSILYNINMKSNEISFSLRAVDRCGQQGLTANITLDVATLVTPKNVEMFNGVMKDCGGYLLMLASLLFYVAISS